MFVIKAVFFFSLVAALVHGSRSGYIRSSRNDLSWKRGTVRSAHEEVVVEAVIHKTSKCLAIAKKKKKSFSDNIYYKIRCRGFKVPKLKPPKRRKTAPKIPKLNIPKLPKLQLPKLQLPELPKINPKAIPKIPKITLVTPRRKPSGSSRSKKKSKKSSKRRTRKRKSKKRKSKSRKKSKPKSRKKRSPKKTKKRKRRASPSPSPRPRQRSRPRKTVSLAKARSSFESAKKRLAKNIAKQETKASKRRVCKTEEYTCGKKCSGRAGPRFLCYYPNNVPKLCTQKTVMPGFCGGQTPTGRNCTRTILEPATCMRNVTITEYCPGAEQGCRLSKVPFGRCLRDKQADECERIKKRKCSYDKRVITTACTQPETECSECKAGFKVKTCAQTVLERVEVPCKGEAKAPPTFDEELLGSGIEGRYLRDLMCFESFFDEGACKTSPRVCRLFDELFDRHLCAGVVCKQCGELLGMLVSDEIKGVCRGFLEGSCRAAGEIPAITEVDTRGKCFETRRVVRKAPCYEKLRKGSICAKGCVTKACRKTVYDVKGYCKRNVPEKCVKGSGEVCKRQTRLVEDCSDERICEYVVKKPFVCFRERMVDVPCVGACENEAEERFVCGSEIQEVEAVCREQFAFRCRDVKCSRQVCV